MSPGIMKQPFREKGRNVLVLFRQMLSFCEDVLLFLNGKIVKQLRVFKFYAGYQIEQN